ncbi:unnamed protein product [Arabidopsis halleri]
MIEMESIQSLEEIQMREEIRMLLKRWIIYVTRILLKL